MTSSSRISLGSATMCFAAFTRDLLRSLSLDFSRDPLLGLPYQLYPILKSPLRKKFIFYYLNNCMKRAILRKNPGGKGNIKIWGIKMMFSDFIERFYKMGSPFI